MKVFFFFNDCTFTHNTNSMLFLCVFFFSMAFFPCKYHQKCWTKQFSCKKYAVIFQKYHNVHQKNCWNQFSIKYPGPKYNFGNLLWLFIPGFYHTSPFIDSPFIDLSNLHTKTYTIFHEGYHPLLLPHICICHFEPFRSLRSNNGYYHLIGDP